MIVRSVYIVGQHISGDARNRVETFAFAFFGMIVLELFIRVVASLSHIDYLVTHAFDQCNLDIDTNNNITKNTR